MGNNNALILSDNVVVANQIACLLGNLNMTSKTVYNRIDAYAALDRSATTESERVNVLVTDIETPELEGNTIAGWYKSVEKDISWYAICRPDHESMPMLIARAQKVDGIFFLNRNGVSLDPSLGLASEILSVRPTPRRSWKLPTPIFPRPSEWLDSGLLAGA